LHGKAARRFRRHRVDQQKARLLPDMEPPAWVFFQNPLHPASATEIRRRRGLIASPPDGQTRQPR
jgi:nicotinate-nucleotide adenylyltransferase